MGIEIVLGLSAIGFISVLLLFLGLDRVFNSKSEMVESRLDRYANRIVQDAQVEQANAPKGRLGRLGRGGDSNKGNQQLAVDLGRADLKLTPSEFIAINLGAIAIGFAIALFLGRMNFAFALVGAVIGFYIPRLYVKILIGRRLDAFNNQLSDTLILLANSLRSGYSLLQAMETVSRELPPPISVEFARVVREIGLGLTIEEALAHMVQRINSDDLDLVTTAVNVQHEVGGNLAEILDTISHTIRERVRIKGQIRAMTASQRLSGNVVAILPIALAIFMYIFNPDYLSKMWKESCGIMMLAFGLITISTGYFAIQKITQIEV